MCNWSEMFEWQVVGFVQWGVCFVEMLCFLVGQVLFCLDLEIFGCCFDVEMIEFGDYVVQIVDVVVCVDLGGYMFFFVLEYVYRCGLCCCCDGCGWIGGFGDFVQDGVVIELCCDVVYCVFVENVVILFDDVILVWIEDQLVE